MTLTRPAMVWAGHSPESMDWLYMAQRFWRTCCGMLLRSARVTLSKPLVVRLHFLRITSAKELQVNGSQEHWVRGKVLRMKAKICCHCEGGTLRWRSHRAFHVDSKASKIWLTSPVNFSWVTVCPAWRGGNPENHKVSWSPMTTSSRRPSDMKGASKSHGRGGSTMTVASSGWQETTVAFWARMSRSTPPLGPEGLGRWPWDSWPVSAWHTAWIAASIRPQSGAKTWPWCHT